MIRRPPRSTRTDTLFPYTPLFRSVPDIAARACQSFVAGEFGLRFNAGVPLVTSEGFRLGTLCVIDKRSEEHTSELQSLMRISYAVFCLKNKTKHRGDDQVNSTLTTQRQ